MALPKPTLQARPSAGLSFLTDESLFTATGVRLGFSRRQGGVSEPPYDGLNLGDHVEDDPMAVAENRALLLDAAGLGSTRLLTLNQVHGDVVLALDDDAAAAWEDQEIVLDPNVVFDDYIYGEHDNKSLEAVLNAIQYSTGIRYRKEESRIVLYKTSH